MLTLSRLVRRNLRYYARDNLVVLLGVAVGAAVLTGSLLVGDSLRGSLRERAERQLNGVEQAYLGTHLIRDVIASQLPGKVAPVFLLRGSIDAVQTTPSLDSQGIGNATILGVDTRFAPTSVPTDTIDWDGDKQVAALPARVAERLGVKVGDRVAVGLEQKSNIPRSSLLGRRDQENVTKTLRATVAAIIAESDPACDFGLIPSPSAGMNVYVPLKALQKAIDQPGRVNALLARGADVRSLNIDFRHALTLDDIGLTIKIAPKRKDYISVESRQLVLSPEIVEALDAATNRLTLRAEPTSVYLANWISRGEERIPYSLVAGLNTLAEAPLGPFLPAGSKPLDGDEIVLVDWPDSPLKDAKPGDDIDLTFFEPELESGARERTQRFRLRTVIPLEGPANDPDLTPPFPGVTDRARIGDWDPPFPYDNKRIKPRDEAFWNKYRTTPKAYISLNAAKRLFASRFGWVTSMRYAPLPGTTAEETIARLQAAFRDSLDFSRLGLQFENTRDRLMQASQGGTDFGMLFLGFSFFLIAAALMLVGLLFRLSLDRRAKETGLLLAAGFAPKQVRRVLLAEGLVLAALGSIVGVALGIAFNRGLLSLLRWLWPDPTVGTFLQAHLTPLSLAIGFAATVLMALAAIALSCRGLVRIAPPALLRGETTLPATSSNSRRFTPWVAIASLGVGLALIASGGAIANPDFRSMSFFGGGALLLTAMLTGLSMWMKRTRRGIITGRGVSGLVRLSVRNAARFPRRSLLTTSLLAAAAFLLVAVESFRRSPSQDFLDILGGSGGFNLLAESAIPLFEPFDSGRGRDDLELNLQQFFGGSDKNPAYLAALKQLAEIQPRDGKPNVYSLRLHGGDDASCLNLYQAARPRVLGLPRELIDRPGFQFSDSEASTPEEKANPWLLLRRPREDDAIPAIVEQNTAMWMLKTSVGGVVEVPDGDGNVTRFRIVGTIVDSPFQSELIIADPAFRKLYPREEGFRVFLMRTPPNEETPIAKILNRGLASYGFVAEPTREKVAAYQSVIGAYLSAFQVLGGLGLLLGVLGLAVVVLRGVWERLGELALFRAFGYRSLHLEILVLAENLLLLFAGLGFGVLAALLSVAPHVTSGASVPWVRLGVMLGVVLLVGFVVAFLATARVLRVPLIPALRRE